MDWTDIAERVAATFVQAAIGAAIPLLTPNVLGDVAAAKRVGIIAAVAGIAAVLSLAKNYLKRLAS